MTFLDDALNSVQIHDTSVVTNLLGEDLVHLCAPERRIDDLAIDADLHRGVQIYDPLFLSPPCLVEIAEVLPRTEGVVVEKGQIVVGIDRILCREAHWFPVCR